MIFGLGWLLVLQLLLLGAFREVKLGRQSLAVRDLSEATELRIARTIGAPDGGSAIGMESRRWRQLRFMTVCAGDTAIDDLELVTHYGAGAYIAGEETAMRMLMSVNMIMSSVETAMTQIRV